MERVAFLIERTGDQLTCLLNPEGLEQRRAAGIVARRGNGGLLIGRARADDALIATGGGVTELDLNLLFDADIALEGQKGPAETVRHRSVDEPEAFAPAAAAPGVARGPSPSAVPPRATPGPDQHQTSAPAKETQPFDIRQLTRPFWALTENGEGDHAEPPIVRFIWGKAWNVPAMVLYVAERLERFDAEGRPRRSWLALRLRRVDAEQARAASNAQSGTQQTSAQPGGASSGPETRTVPLDNDGGPMERLDQLAASRYGDPELAWALAASNQLDDPLTLALGNGSSAPRSARVTLPSASHLGLPG